MTIMRLGVDLAGEPLFQPMEEEDLGRALAGALGRNADSVRSLTQITAQAASFKGEVERAVLDAGDPRVAGWTYLVNSKDSRRDDYAALLEPLARHRDMSDPTDPLIYNGEPEDEWFDWLSDNYFALSLEGKEVPGYLLIVGGPQQVPFRFQSILDTVANVGRIDLPLEDLKQYIDKLIRLENAPEPIVERSVILFGTDEGPSDPTYFSRRYMVEPLGDHIRDKYGLQTHELLGYHATKANLLDAVHARQPALMYTASHGLGAKDESADMQRRYNGAICCQHSGSLTPDHLVSADDVPSDQPFLEGAIFFQFACFGYGTPAESDYAHWLGDVPESYTDADFIAALPKALLAHPRGPIAFIGHLDTAFLHGFTDQDDPHILNRWHARLAPFVHAIDQLLGVQPCALAMDDMSKRYSVCNAVLANTHDRERRGKLRWTPALMRRFVDNWVIRGDAQNYMIFGDPAARLRIPAG